MARETQVSSFTVPKPLARNLRHVAKRLGVTQSALVSELLGEPLVAPLAESKIRDLNNLARMLEPKKDR